MYYSAIPTLFMYICVVQRPPCLCTTVPFPLCLCTYVLYRDLSGSASAHSSSKIPTQDQQIALCLLMELAVQRGSLGHILSAVLLLLNLWNNRSVTTRHQCVNRKRAWAHVCESPYLVRPPLKSMQQSVHVPVLGTCGVEITAWQNCTDAVRPHFILNILLGCFFLPFRLQSPSLWQPREQQPAGGAPHPAVAALWEHPQLQVTDPQTLPPLGWCKAMLLQNLPPTPPCIRKWYCVTGIMTWDGVRLMLMKKHCILLWCLLTALKMIFTVWHW